MSRVFFHSADARIGYASFLDSLFHLSRRRKPEVNRSKILLLDEGHCLRDHALAACDSKTKANVDAFKATSLLTLVQMVANGTGITLLPELVINLTVIEK